MGVIRCINRCLRSLVVLVEITLCVCPTVEGVRICCFCRFGRRCACVGRSRIDFRLAGTEHTTVPVVPRDCYFIIAFIAEVRNNSNIPGKRECRVSRCCFSGSGQISPTQELICFAIIRYGHIIHGRTIIKRTCARECTCTCRVAFERNGVFVRRSVKDRLIRSIRHYGLDLRIPSERVGILRGSCFGRQVRADRSLAIVVFLRLANAVIFVLEGNRVL